MKYASTIRVLLERSMLYQGFIGGQSMQSGSASLQYLFAEVTIPIVVELG
jgi:hypothetical protein